MITFWQGQRSTRRNKWVYEIIDTKREGQRSKLALPVIDMQNDLCSEEMYCFQGHNWAKYTVLDPYALGIPKSLGHQ